MATFEYCAAAKSGWSRAEPPSAASAAARSRRAQVAHEARRVHRERAQRRRALAVARGRLRLDEAGEQRGDRRIETGGQRAAVAQLVEHHAREDLRVARDAVAALAVGRRARAVREHVARVRLERDAPALRDDERGRRRAQRGAPAVEARGERGERVGDRGRRVRADRPARERARLPRRRVRVARVARHRLVERGRERVGSAARACRERRREEETEQRNIMVFQIFGCPDRTSAYHHVDPRLAGRRAFGARGRASRRRARSASTRSRSRGGAPSARRSPRSRCVRRAACAPRAAAAAAAAGPAGTTCSRSSRPRVLRRARDERACAGRRVVARHRGARAPRRGARGRARHGARDASAACTARGASCTRTGAITNLAVGLPLGGKLGPLCVPARPDRTRAARSSVRARHRARAPWSSLRGATRARRHGRRRARARDGTRSTRWASRTTAGTAVDVNFRRITFSLDARPLRPAGRARGASCRTGRARARAAARRAARERRQGAAAHLDRATRLTRARRRRALRLPARGERDAAALGPRSATRSTASARAPWRAPRPAPGARRT